MGIPSQAVKQQKQIDRKATINATMLQSVKLKKTLTGKSSNQTDSGFEPPSLDTLQMALRKLRSIISDN